MSNNETSDDSKTPEEAEADDDEIISVADNSKDIPSIPTAIEMEPPKEKSSELIGMLMQRESFRDLWIKDMRRIGCEIEFFKWFEMTGRIENCDESLQVIINKWYTASNKVVESITPPLEGINIPIAGIVIKVSPFKEKSDKTGGLLISADIDRVVEQNNYSNQVLHIISRQIEDTKPNLSGRPTPASTSSSHNIETYPGFKIPEFSKEKFPKLSYTFEVTENIIEKINAKLNNFNISIEIWISGRNALSVAYLPSLMINSKKSNLSLEKNLGSFCRDFSFITPPDKIKKDKKEKSHRKKSQRRDDSTRSKKKKHRSKRPRDTKLDVCWTCGKTGHKASECRSGVKKKKINLLNMDGETKGKLLDEPFSESSGTSDEYSDVEDIDLDYDSDKSQSGKDCTCTEAFCTCDSTPHIRVLSDHSKESLFDVIQHINDNEARNRFLLKLKNLLLNTDKPKPRQIIELFSMKQIMNLSDNHSEPSISDLCHEVSSLKEQIRNINSQLCIVETDILTNQVPKRTTFHDLESNQTTGPPSTGLNALLATTTLQNTVDQRLNEGSAFARVSGGGTNGLAIFAYGRLLSLLEGVIGLNDIMFFLQKFTG
ncbi:hypothetical protein H5410_047789 [Solanum commersonii]|uniref:CCHC-type domain-containing protein n=1 Tax=Solanum commersonii TaxID=4109 RepID=A0A9J5XG75_SOLCO|nr:hypothetical protein H5410_047789 [Solanum commersonii]